MQWTRFTIFHVIWLVALVAGGGIGSMLGSTWGPWGRIGGGGLGLVAGHFLGTLPEVLSWSALLKTIEHGSNEELWAMVNLPFWNMCQTLALLQLAAREQEVRGELPRIIGMLESDDDLERVYGWDALRLVFDEEYRVIEDYEPREPLSTCRERVEHLKASMNGAARFNLAVKCSVN